MESWSTVSGENEDCFEGPITPLPQNSTTPFFTRWLLYNSCSKYLLRIYTLPLRMSNPLCYDRSQKHQTTMNTTPINPFKTDDLQAALLVLEQIDSETPLNSPSVLTVFRLYCVRAMSVAQVARACRCSVGTVSNRLKLLRSKTGADPRNLRNERFERPNDC